MAMVNLTEQQWLLWKVFFFSLIVRSLSGDLNILVLFSFHQFEGLPVKTDNGVRRPI